MVKITIEFESGYIEDRVVQTLPPDVAWKVIKLICPERFMSKSEFIDKWMVIKPIDSKE